MRISLPSIVNSSSEHYRQTWLAMFRNSFAPASHVSAHSSYFYTAPRNRRSEKQSLRPLRTEPIFASRADGFTHQSDASGNREVRVFLAFEFERSVTGVSGLGQNRGDAVVIQIESVPVAAAVI